jgi:hypothetical protein
MQTIEIKRATKNVSFEVLRSFTDNKYYNLVIYKHSEPIWGGFYSVTMLTKHNTEVRAKNGLCLDAAIDIYNQTKKQLITQ